MQPIAKRCKALGISPAVMGYAKKETKRNPGRKCQCEYLVHSESDYTINEARQRQPSLGKWSVSALPR